MTPLATTVDGADDAVLLDVVRQAWTEALPATPFDPDTSWEASGADSLRSLHLVMNLERALGRRVPFDLITRQMTARDLARVLASPPAEPHAVAGSTVFLIPGVFGDGPILAEFRRSFAGDPRFVVVDLPDMDEPVTLHADLRATGRFIADAIEQHAPEGSIHLAGFSYGGVAAFEAAHHLLRRGRHVAFLGLLDSFAGSGDAPPAGAVDAANGPSAPEAGVGGGGLLARIRPRRGEGLVAYGERVIFGLALKFDRIDLARKVTLAGRQRLSQDQVIGRRKIVLGLGRMRAIGSWAPQPLDVPTFLACTDDGEKRGSPAQWAVLCSRLQVQRVPGGHFDIFSPGALAVLTPAFRKAVLAADAVV